MDLFLMIVWLLAFGVTLSGAFRGGVDSPHWELRWRLLGSADRTRISTAARSGTKLDDPEEAELAAGFMRRDRRRHSYIELPVAASVVALTALSLAGLVDGGFVVFITACITAGIGLWRYLREKQMNGTPRTATSSDAGL